MEINKQRICEICYKRFANGKAMGGHMRSHLAKLPVPTKPTQTPRHNYLHISTPPPPLPPKRAPPSSSSSLVGWLSSTKTQVQYLSNPRSLGSHEPVAFPRSSSLDRESETDSSPRNPTRKRSKRRRRWESWGCSDEEVAMCLLMLSMDKWRKDEIKINPVVGEQYEKQDFVDDHEEENLDEDEEEEEEFFVGGGGRGKSKRRKYKCGTCSKTFRSYQALGGHRASHKNKKLKLCVGGMVEEEQEDEDQISGRSVGDFDCPYCDKVFESGQALGGHKKVHFSYLGIVNPRNFHDSYLNDSDSLLDLNLPAEPEEEDEEVEEEASTVSNAEFRSRLS